MPSDKSTDKRQQFVDEIVEPPFYSRCGIDSDGKLATEECECFDHPEELPKQLREGNFAVCILQRKEAPEYYECDGPMWIVDGICCDQCPASSLYERADKDVPTAVVEGQLQNGDDCLVFSPRYVWDLHIPKKNLTNVSK